MRTVRRLALVGLLVAAASLCLGPASVFAASGNGRHVNTVDCTTSDGLTVCATIFGEISETFTPSGNAIFTFNYRWTFTVTDSSGAVVSTASGRDHFQALYLKDVAQHEYQGHTRYTTTEGGQTCIVTVAFHFTGDHTQFDRFTLTCE